MSRANLHEAGSQQDALEVFPEWTEPVTSRRLLRAGIGSLIVHAIVAAMFYWLISGSFMLDLIALGIIALFAFIVTRLRKRRQQNPIV